MGGCQNGQTVNQSVYDKVIHKTQKRNKTIKGKCDFCGRAESQRFTKEVSRGEVFVEKGNNIYNQCSSMLNSAWFDLSSTGDKL